MGCGPTTRQVLYFPPMLHLASDTNAALELIKRDPELDIKLRAHLWREREHPLIVYVDNPAQPTVFALRHGIGFMPIAPPGRYPALMGDLFHARIEGGEPWPDEIMRAEWAKDPGRPRLGLNAAPVSAIEAAFAAGFERSPEEERHRPHWIYYITGKPHLQDRVKHSCRLGVGQELYDLLRQGIGYDETGEYTRRCLDAGASFVCEVDGVPVCWACTHLSGSMGMIYTPPEHRRNGYANSLAAFQIDYVLEHFGLAFCHVNAENEASNRNVLSLGMCRLPEPVTGRTLFWPEGREPR